MMGHAQISTTMRCIHHVPRTAGAARLTGLLAKANDEAVGATMEPQSADDEEGVGIGIGGLEPDP